MKFNINERGEKVELHSMKIAEVRATQKWSNHSDRLYADYDFPDYSISELIEWYEAKTDKARALISICNLNGELIGYISLRDIRRFFKTSELGIVLNPSKINQGYGTEAISLFIKWYFKKLRYRKLYLSVAMYNDRAYRVYEKLGFKNKFIFWDRFLNDEINPIIDIKYRGIRDYFKEIKGILYIKCIKMELSP